MYVKDLLMTSELLNSSTDVVEVLVIENENFNLVIAIIYKPPDAIPQEFIEQLRNVESYFDNLGNSALKFIFLGDLYYPDIDGNGYETTVLPRISLKVVQRNSYTKGNYLY